MNLNVSPTDLKFLVSCLKQLDRYLSQKKQDEMTTERLFTLRNLTARFERRSLNE